MIINNMLGVSLAAESIFKIGALPVTNSMINTWIAAVFLIIIAWVLRKKYSDVPRGLQNFAEMVIEWMLSFMDTITHDRKKSERFFPLVGTLFIFILLSNWLSQLPGTGSIGIWELEEGKKVFVPLLRPATSDLNTTLALSLVGVLATHFFGITAIGIFKHLNKFINLGGIWSAIKTLNPVNIFVAIIQFFVGLIEVFSEVAKTISLSLRLFGNVFAGEVLLTVIGSLIAFLVPLPFMFLELLVGFIQATIFAVLVLVFAEIATSEHH